MPHTFLKGNIIGSSSGAQVTPWQELLQGHLSAHHTAQTQDFSPATYPLAPASASSPTWFFCLERAHTISNWIIPFSISKPLTLEKAPGNEIQGNFPGACLKALYNQYFYHIPPSTNNSQAFRVSATTGHSPSPKNTPSFPWRFYQILF